MNDVTFTLKKAVGSVCALLLLVGLLTMLPGNSAAQVLATSCPNSDFSQGNFLQWHGCYGTFDNPCNSDGLYQIPPNQRHLIILGPGTADPHSCGTVMSVFPGSAYSARLGNDNVRGFAPGYGEQLDYTVTVTDDKYLFIYRYAILLEDNGHVAAQQPSFTIDIVNSIGQVIDPICGHYYEYAHPGMTGWGTCNQTGYMPIYYQDWQTVGMDLTPYLGQTITIRFITRDCRPGGHFGYAYISAYCSYLQVRTSMCTGDTAAVLTAPPGFTYLWSNGATTASITVPHPTTGEVYTCTLTAKNGCSVTIADTLTYTEIHSDYTFSNACTDTPIQFTDASTVNQNFVANWKWDFGDGIIVNGVANPIHTYTTAGSYNVKLISFSMEGCKDSITKTVVVDTLPNVSNSDHRKEMCSGGNTNITLTSNVTSPLYTWTATSSAITLTGWSDQATPGTGLISQVLVNTANTKDSVTYTIVPHKGQCNGPAFTYVVVVDPKPGVNFNPVSPQVCSNTPTNVGLSSLVSGTTFTWTATPGSINVTGYGPGSGNTIAQTLVTPGFVQETVTYHVVPSANTCPGDTGHVTVLVNPQPHLVTDPMSQTICSKYQTNIVLLSSCSNTSFTWTSTVAVGNITGNTNGAGSSIVNTLTNTLPTQGRVDYTITPTAGTCIGRDTIYSVLVDPNPRVTNSPLSIEICSNTSTNINLLSDVANPTFSWIATGSSGNVSGYSSGSGPSIIQTLLNTGPGPEIVTYHIAATANGCSGDTAYLAVTVQPLPVPVISGAVSVCLNSNTVYGTAAGMTNYVWTVSAGGSITAGTGTNTITVNWTANGAQTITVTYTDTHGCDPATPTTYNVNVSLLPVPGLVGKNSVCVGDFVNYNTDPGMTGYAWVVSAGGAITGGGGSSDDNVTVHWTVTGAQNVTVNYQAGPGCSSPSPTVMDVTVHPLPSPVISGLASVCEGSAGNTYSTSAGMTGYTWSISGGGSITAGGTSLDDAITVTWNTPGAQTVSVNYTDLFGCTALAPSVYPVTVNALPVPAIAGLTGVCAGTTGIVYSTQPGNTNYQWTVSAGGSITAGGTNTDNTVTVTWNTPGPQTVTVNFVDGNSCTAVSPTSYPVTIYTLPIPGLNGSNKICTGSTGIVYTTEAGMTNYSWTVSGGGNITAGGTATDNTVTVTWNTAGPQSVSVNYHDLNNCTAVSATVYTVTVDPLPVPTISGNNSLCAGTTGVVYTTEPGMSNYTWTISPGGSVTAGGTAVSPTVTVTWNTAGPQNVSVNYNDLNGCRAVSQTNFLVTVNPLPAPTIAGPAVVCAGSTGNVYSTQPGKTNYQWVVSVGGAISSGGTATDNTVTVNWTTPLPQTVSVNYFDANGCTAVAPVVYPVTVNPRPVPAISGPATICLNASAVYNTAPGMTGYTWTVTAGGNITAGWATDAITILWNTTGPQTVTVNYIDANGCTAAAPSTYSVNVNTLPLPSLSGLNAICTGFSATYTTDVGMNNYTWAVSAGGSIMGGGGSSDNTATIHWTGTGPQTISVNYVAGTNCTAPTPTVYNVTVNPLPTPTIAGTNILCAGPATYVYTTQAGKTNYQWTVSAGGVITGGGSTSDNTVSVRWPTAGPQTVTINYIDANGCTALASSSYSVTVNPLPVPTVSGAPSVCLNSSSVYFTEAGMVGYSWSVSAGGTITLLAGNSITVQWNTTGAKTIQVNYFDANGCTAAAPTLYNVTVNTLPVPSLAGTNSLCSGLTAVYTTDPGMNNYSWTVSPGGGIIAGGGPTNNTVTVLWNTAGAQTVSVNYVMGTGCTAALPTVYNVTVKPRPLVTNAANSSMCSGGTTNIAPLANLPLTTFSWTAAGSSGNVSGFNNGAGTSITDNLINTGFNTENVNYSVTPSLNGCDGTVAHYIVTVFPVADVYFTPNGQSFCGSGTTSISLQSHVTGSTFTWTATPSSGNVSGYGPGNLTSIVQTLTNSGPYIENVNYSVTPSANSCVGTNDHVIVDLIPVPAVSFDMACSSLTTTTDAKSFTLRGGIPTGGTYSGLGVSAGKFFPGIAGPGSHSVTYAYSNTWGCNSSVTRNISVISAVPFPCDNILTDVRDLKQYPTVKLGTQCWMAQNLNIGNQVPSTAMQSDNCVIEKYCYNDAAGNCASEGGLYQWDEMMQFEDVAALQGICPPSWHVPTENDWATLFNFYISNGFAASPLKSTGYSGFDAFLDGARFHNVNWNFTSFATYFWSSNSHGPVKAWAHAMNSFDPSVSYYPGNRSNAFSLRCIKD
jgi:uncharacterized protein (TIGR02145 family)